MIRGIGVDIVRVPRIQAGLARFGDRYARRLTTPEEYAAYRRAARPAHFLAKRFAAKEAAAKALGTGFRFGLSLRHIGVVADELGRPGLEFRARARELAAERGIRAAHLSLADEDDYAVAYVVLEGP